MASRWQTRVSWCPRRWGTTRCRSRRWGGALAYCSPFRRARETMAGVLAGAGVDAGSVRVFEDPRLREVDHGYVDAEAQKGMRATHGWFYYRYNGGESPADCYDRTCTFLESLMRQ